MVDQNPTNLKQTNSLTNLQFQGTPDKIAAEINEFFVSVSNHLPKVDPSILVDLNNDYCSDFTIDQGESSRPPIVRYGIGDENS